MRHVPIDPRKPCEDGWCWNTKVLPPTACSWCGRSYFVRKGVLMCSLCDVPSTGGLSAQDFLPKDQGPRA